MKTERHDIKQRNILYLEWVKIKNYKISRPVFKTTEKRKEVLQKEKQKFWKIVSGQIKCRTNFRPH